MRKGRKLGIAAAIAFAAAVLAGCACPALAEEDPPAADDAAEQARALADEVLRKVRAGGGEGLGEWTRSVIVRALARAGLAAESADPLPAGEIPGKADASIAPGGVSTGRANTAEVIVFTSLALPAASWRQWSREAARAGAAMVLRGVGEAGLRATVQRIAERLPENGAGAAVDPRLFRLFRIEVVPAVAVVPGGVPACASRGCADDPTPPHDLIAGNIGLEAALEAIAREGEAGRATARRYLSVLRGEGE